MPLSPFAKRNSNDIAARQKHVRDKVYRIVTYIASTNGKPQQVRRKRLQNKHSTFWDGRDSNPDDLSDCRF
jgi:hypothetical protein